MSKAADFLVFLVRSVTAGLAIAFLVIYLLPQVTERWRQAPVEGTEMPVAAAPHSYAEAVNRAAPAVVSIYTRSVTTGPFPGDSELGGSNRLMYRLKQDMGSGVLMSENGYILTNHHVINRVQNIRVGLWDGRIAAARVVGSDPATDLAVLKVDLNDLPVAPLGDSTTLRVGDVVLAIGNALGLSHTVTLGIVSATGRNDLRSSLYEDFIQTDAAINAGNSGGALINAGGELIGINARNLDAARGAQNIGFAIPIDLALNVMQQIIDTGSVQRSWLGALYSDIRPSTLADGSAARRGIAVRDVARGGPAWNAGIRQGDIITELDGEPVDDASQFILTVSQKRPGEQVELLVNRRGEAFQTYATLIQQPPIP
jgi:serine peptidase DegS